MPAYLADTSAWHRSDQVAERWSDLIERDGLLLCTPVRLELLYSARGADYEPLARELDGFRQLALDAQAEVAAMRIQESLAEKSQHLYGRAIDVSFDRRLLDAETAARRMARGGVGWYPRSHFVHLDTGPTRNWEMNGTGLDRVLSASAGGTRMPRELSVADRLARHRALSRSEFLHRKQ